MGEERDFAHNSRSTQLKTCRRCGDHDIDFKDEMYRTCVVLLARRVSFDPEYSIGVLDLSSKLNFWIAHEYSPIKKYPSVPSR